MVKECAGVGAVGDEAVVPRARNARPDQPVALIARDAVVGRSSLPQDSDATGDARAGLFSAVLDRIGDATGHAAAATEGSSAGSADLVIAQLRPVAVSEYASAAVLDAIRRDRAERRNRVPRPMVVSGGRAARGDLLPLGGAQGGPVDRREVDLADQRRAVRRGGAPTGRSVGDRRPDDDRGRRVEPEERDRRRDRTDAVPGGRPHPGVQPRLRQRRRRGRDTVPACVSPATTIVIGPPVTTVVGRGPTSTTARRWSADELLAI